MPRLGIAWLGQPILEPMVVGETRGIALAECRPPQGSLVRVGRNISLRSSDHGNAVMRAAPPEALDRFDEVFTRQINSVYRRKSLRPLQSQQWSGAICKAYVFGNGVVDWSDANELRSKLDALLRERRGSSLTITRITRLYDKGFLFLLKPDRHRFWTRSIALQDADDVLADLRSQGF